MDIGACELDQFEFQDKPLYYTQQHWDDKCFVCQAFARDLEVYGWDYDDLMCGDGCGDHDHDHDHHGADDSVCF